MKAYVLEEIGQLNLKEIVAPTPNKDEVLIEVHAAGICGSDIPRIYINGTYTFPLIPGHEFSGKVIEVADQKNKKWLNKRVGIFPLIPCKVCSSCKNKKYEVCTNYNYLGSRCNGGFAEYVAVPTWNIINIPDNITYEEAAMLEPASVALHAIRRVDLSGVKSVVLYGLGTIGMLIAQWLHIFNIKNVYAIGHHNQNGLLMKETINENYQYLDCENDKDAIYWIRKHVNESGVDLAIDCVGTGQVIQGCLQIVRPGGQVLVVGNPSSDIELSKEIYWKILRNQISLHGTWNSTFTHRKEDDWNITISNIYEGKLNLNSLITHKYNFENLPKGLEIMKSHMEFRNKVMICR